MTDAIRSPQPEIARLHALEQLDHLRLQFGNCVTEIAVAAGRHLLAPNSESRFPDMKLMDDGELHIRFAALILADLADASMCPAPLLSEIVEDGTVSFQEVRSRRQRAKEMVAAAPETRRLAVQLLADPSGTSVRSPRIRRVRLSQSEILATALTE